MVHMLRMKACGNRVSDEIGFYFPGVNTNQLNGLCSCFLFLTPLAQIASYIMYFFVHYHSKVWGQYIFFFIQQEWDKLVKSDSKNLDIVKKIAVLLNFLLIKDAEVD